MCVTVKTGCKLDSNKTNQWTVFKTNIENIFLFYKTYKMG